MTTHKKYTFLLFLLGMLSAFGPFVTDLYLPALPSLADFFQATPSMTQLSLTMSMLGLSVGQIFIGPLSDKFGRKKLLLGCLVMFIVGTAACILSPDMVCFNVFRLFQGMAASGGIVIARSVSADSYRGPVLNRFLAMVSAVNGVAPILAPVVGGFLLNFMDWRGTYAVLLFYGLLLLFMGGKFQESLPVNRRSKKSIFANFTLYGAVFRNGEFVQYFFVCALPMIVLFGYIAASPFIYQKIYGLPALGFSCCFALNALCIAIGCAVSAKFKNGHNALRLAGFGLVLFSILIAFALLNHAPLYLLHPCIMGILFMFGLIQPPSNACALNAERRNAGTASAAIGSAIFLMGGIASPLVGMGNLVVSTSVILVVGALLSLVAILFACKGK